MFSSLFCPGRCSAQPLQFPSTPGLFPADNTYTNEYTTYIQHLTNSPAWSIFASMLLPATTPLYHALGQAIPSSLGSIYSLQKQLSAITFFQPLQKSSVPQTWQNIRPCSALKRFWLKTGLPAHWSGEDRLSKMCMCTTEKYCPPEISSDLINYNCLWMTKPSLWNATGLQKLSLLQMNDFSPPHIHK